MRNNKTDQKRLVKASPHPAFVLILKYADGERRLLDCSQLTATVDFLRDYNNFCRVYVDDAGAVCWDRDPNIDSEIVWENKVDLCPDGCYTNSRHLFQACEDPKNYETVSLELELERYLEANKRYSEYGITFEEAMNLYMEDLLWENSRPSEAEKKDEMGEDQ